MIVLEIVEVLELDQDIEFAFHLYLEAMNALHSLIPRQKYVLHCPACVRADEILSIYKFDILKHFRILKFCFQ